MSTTNEVPFLHWLLLGQSEPFDIWVHVALDWDQADALVEADVPDIDALLRRAVGNRAQLVMEDAGRPLVSISWTITAESPSILGPLQTLQAQIAELIAQQDPDAFALSAAQHELAPLLTA